jgi:signal transduction histidine kinase
MKNVTEEKYTGTIQNKTLFQALPGCYLLLQPTDDFLIVNATNNYLSVARTTRKIIGQPLFSVFPDNPSNPHADGVQNLTASLREVIRTCKCHHMQVQRYDTRNPVNGAFEARYWMALNIPVLDKAGNLQAILHSVEDVTENVRQQKRMHKLDQTIQQQITDAISTTQELERMEISRELHDNVNQILLTARLYIGRALEKEMPDKLMIRSGYELLESAVEEIKKISQALMITSQEEESMTTAIENLLRQITSSGSIDVHHTIQLPDESLIESKVKVAVFRIVQEQLSNVIKHAEATNLYISIEFKDSLLKLTIRDDGKGFHPAEKKPGLGFQNMKSRVAFMNGNINIHSSPGDGCTIDVHIPVNKLAAM